MAEVGEKIKNIRELKNFTQEYMAEKLGMTQAGYSKLESGATSVTYDKLVKIAQILDVNLEDITTFDNQKYFNSFNNVKGSNNGSITIQIEDKEVRKLYTDQIELLKKLLGQTEKELNRYRDRYGDL